MRTVDRIQKMASPLMTEREQEMARVAQRCIMEALDHSRAVQITLTTDTGEHPAIALPPASLKFIGQILGAMSEGRSIALIPENREFTTVEAANLLNVSRPFLIKEIEAGRLKHRMVGTHRRIAFEDLTAYARQMRERQEAALDRLATNTRELGLDY